MNFACGEKNPSPTPTQKGEGLNPASSSSFTVGRTYAAWFFSPRGRRSRQRDEGASYPYLSTRALSSDPAGHLLPLGEKKPGRILSPQRRLRQIALFLTLLFTTIPAFAFNPDEVLSDPALEARARALTVQLRCMVCQNQSIDDSNAELARDLRVLVRDRLTQGDSDEAVMNYVVSRYGEFVLLKPRVSARTIALWGAPVVLILIGATAIFVFARRRVVMSEGQKLTVDEEARIRDLLG